MFYLYDIARCAIYPNVHDVTYIFPLFVKSAPTHPPMPGPVTPSGPSYTLPTYTGDVGDCTLPSPPIRVLPSFSHDGT